MTQIEQDREMKRMPKTLGILGGLGPMATVYFYELLTKHTFASCDQEHLDIILNSRASTPDRTAYILGQSQENPFDIMVADAQRLVCFGADVLAIPCNTAHYFYDRLHKTISVPILNMVEQTVLEAKNQHCACVGVLATTGTIATQTYQKMCHLHDVACVIPDEMDQKEIMHIIYNEIKQGKPASLSRFFEVVTHLKQKGCTKIILGCTELSLLKKETKLNAFYLDSMEVLAKHAIKTFGRTPTGFEEDFSCVDL